MKTLAAIWELTVAFFVDLFTKDEETENEQWVRERTEYAKQAKKQQRHWH